MSPLSKSLSNYYRQIKLGPAIGDWMVYHSDDMPNQLRSAQQLPVAFDSLSVTQLKQGLNMHYRLADYLTTQLSQGLETKVELHSVDVLQVPYNAFVSSLTAHKVQSRWQLGRWGWFHMLMDGSFASLVIDRLVGGKGVEVPSDMTAFSELELDILDAQMNEFVPSYLELWRPLIEDTEVHLTFAHGPLKKDNRSSGRSATIVFGLDFDFGESGLHRIMIAYPNVTLKNLLLGYNKTHQKLVPRVELMPETLSQIQVPVKSVLGTTRLTMAELAALQVGDIIPLGLPLGSPVDIRVDSVLSMRGMVGIRQNQLAVQITDNPELQQKLKSYVVRDREEPVSPQSDYLPVAGATQLSMFAPVYAPMGRQDLDREEIEDEDTYKQKEDAVSVDDTENDLAMDSLSDDSIEDDSTSDDLELDDDTHDDEFSWDDLDEDDEK